MALGLSSPLPRPQTARRSRCKGARNAREPATHPCGAAGASGSHCPLLRFTRRLSGDGANKKFGRCRGVQRPAAANGPAAGPASAREARQSRLGQALDVGAPANGWTAQACPRAHSELALADYGWSPAPITIDSDPESDRPN